MPGSTGGGWAQSHLRPSLSTIPQVPESVISIKGLHKSYGEFEAVRGMSLEVARGEVFAFLGPNGAGKTTTVEILEGYRDRSSGEVSVLGQDPAGAGRDWREQIGIVLQDSELDPYLTVSESISLYAGYYRNPRPVAEVIELVGLGSKADDRAGKLSGGQRRRLDVGIALVGDPELLFLDEPTTGFDPSARRQAWDVIAGLRDLGKTVFLTTHYMDEAQFLADHVTIIRRGEVVASGTPDDLGTRSTDPTKISFELPASIGADRLPPALGETSTEHRTTTILSDSPVDTVHTLTGWALENAIELIDLDVRRPSLEDSYLRLTAETDGGGDE